MLQLSICIDILHLVDHPSVIPSCIITYFRDLNKAQKDFTEDLFKLAEEATIVETYDNIENALTIEERVR